MEKIWLEQAKENQRKQYENEELGQTEAQDDRTQIYREGEKESQQMESFT